MQDVDRLLQAIPIHAYIERVVSLKKRGANYIGLCPFHSEKTPSFTVSPERGIFKCFGCGKGGNLITFVQDYERVSFREALEILSRYSGIELEKKSYADSRQTKERDERFYSILRWVHKLYQERISSVQGYLDGRHVSAVSVSHFALGYAPSDYHFLEQQVQLHFKNSQRIQEAHEVLLALGLLGRGDDGGYYNRFRDRLMFPIFDSRNRVIGFGGRQVEKNDKSAKYINSNESEVFSKKDILFHFSQSLDAARKNKQMIVVEGYFDVLGLYQQGIENAVGSMGTAFTQAQARLLQRVCDRVILFFDGDKAGMDAAFKSFSVCKSINLPAYVVTEHSRSEKKLDPFDLSLQLDNFSFLQMLANSKTESDFIFWYFFSYKYNISQEGQKALAIDDFFSFVKTLPQEWEKEEYLKKSAAVLNVSQNSLLRDFQKGKVSSVVPVERKLKPRKEVLPPQEKDFILILLRYSEFWQMRHLLEQMHWQSKRLYLLYSFFRDRALVGNFFTLAESAHIVQELPSELSSLFADISAKDSFEAEEKLSPQEEETAKKNHEQTLKAIIWRSCSEFYRKESERLQRELEEHERLSRLSAQDDSSLLDELTIELKTAIDQKEHYLKLLQKEKL